MDGVPFLMRDRTLRRTTDVTKIFPSRQYDDASFFNWTEIRSLNAGSWFLEVLNSLWSRRETQYNKILEIGIRPLKRIIDRETFLSDCSVESAMKAVPNKHNILCV